MAKMRLGILVLFALSLAGCGASSSSGADRDLSGTSWSNGQVSLEFTSSAAFAFTSLNSAEKKFFADADGANAISAEPSTPLKGSWSYSSTYYVSTLTLVFADYPTLPKAFTVTFDTDYLENEEMCLSSADGTDLSLDKQ
jgi:hypothetical protein